MYELPTTVDVFDRTYQIRQNGDYRLILEVVTAWRKPDFTQDERAVAALTLFYDGVDTAEDVFNEFETVDLLQEAAKQMMFFISCGDDDSNGYKTNYELIDWKNDEKLIVSAINPMLGQGQDVRFIKYMHWWTFISYYMGIRESALATVVEIRGKIVKGKKLEKYEQEFRRDNPEYFNWRQSEKTQDEKDFEEYIKDIWKNNFKGR